MSSNASSPTASMIQDDAAAPAQRPLPQQSWFHLPAPVKRVFDRFPLITYEENELPLRSAAREDGNVLHVFTTVEEGQTGTPSYNPGCLRWQAYLRFAGVEFRTVASSNHASPSGILPFLMPAVQSPGKQRQAIPSSKIKKWTSKYATGSVGEPSDKRYEAYMSLLETAIRKAWLYQLYISPENAKVVHKLYVAPCSTNPLVQASISYNLRQAAETELAKSSYSGTISETNIFSDAEDAFAALDSLLGSTEWYFEAPSMLDAALFAYTHLILDEGMAWGDNKLGALLGKQNSLVAHRERILDVYF
ncbi:hypothetical protein B0A48_08480 [Cryoendolithus antarcticus]|uniref:Thioredoxin-like fold domain-containing protein n=1 Tax=Cryoendolithus antarcticus TaxID=1507870 RepID=A0A1V8T5K2_9PEZI|nr:hypothetical protein B0A48_08480 [Cryoendolithus antarcticus]